MHPLPSEVFDISIGHIPFFVLPRVVYGFEDDQVAVRVNFRMEIALMSIASFFESV